MTTKLRLALLTVAAASLVLTGAPGVQAAVPDLGAASAAKPCKAGGKKKQKKQKKQQGKRITCGSAKKPPTHRDPPPPPPPPPFQLPIEDCEALAVDLFPTVLLPCR